MSNYFQRARSGCPRVVQIPLPLHDSHLLDCQEGTDIMIAVEITRIRTRVAYDPQDLDLQGFAHPIFAQSLQEEVKNAGFSQ